MTRESNRAILASVSAETAVGSGRPFVEALADEVRWTIIGSTDWSKTCLGRASGREYENSCCWVIRMQDGKMRELTEYADTQLIAAALGPRPPSGEGAAES